MVMTKDKSQFNKAEQKYDEEEYDSDCGSCTSEQSNESYDVSEELDDKINMKQYRQLVSKIFPSKYARERANKTKNGESSKRDDKSSKNIKKHKKEDKKSDKKCDKKNDKKEEDEIKKKKNKKGKKELEKNKHESSDDEESYSSGSESDNESIDKSLSLQRDISKLLSGESPRDSRFNIVFTMGNPNSIIDEDWLDEEDEEWDEYDEYDEYDEEDSEDITDTESNASDESDEEYIPMKTRSKKSSKNTNVSKDDDEEDSEVDPSSKKEKKSNNTIGSETEEDIFNKLRSTLSVFNDEDKKHPVLKHLIGEFNEQEKKHLKEEKKKSKKKRVKNTSKFRELLKEKNVMNDVTFFRDNLTVEEQKNVIKQVSEIKKHSEVTKPYRLAILDSDIPIEFKACAYKKINTLRYMEPGGGEYYKMKQWVDAFMNIPFGVHKNLPLSIEDGVDKCHTFMEEAKGILDKAVYGLEDAKLQIMQMVGQWIANPAAVGSAIAIKGPMGTGKTTLVKEGISKILGRDFAFIALGGATDSSFLEGHSYTYEGSRWGKIVEIILQCKNMNPIIYFDELDKVSDTPKGDEIIGILTHLTDISQNSKYHDKFFSEIDFDLSRCLFIFSYNDESKVNPILLDRMYRIQTKGYTDNDKVIIGNNYMLPKVRSQVNFTSEDIKIPDDTIKHIVKNFTDKEEGVRNMQRCMEIIHTKLNLYRLMKPGSNIFEKDMDLKVTFPMVVTPEIVDKLIKKSEDTLNSNARAMAMYM